MPKETKQEQALQEQEEVEELPEETETKETAAEQTPVVEEAAPVEEKAEAKAKRKKKEEIVEERFYTIPLSKALIRPPKKRAPRAMSLLKIFVIKHMKIDMKVSDEEEAEELPQLIVSKEVNEKIWDRGIEKPPRKIKVRITKDKDGNVTVFLAENKKQ
jgi:large subunit ribosomal protein L31e